MQVQIKLSKKNLPKNFVKQIKQLPLHIQEFLKKGLGIPIKIASFGLAYSLGHPELAYEILTSMIPDTLNLTNSILNSEHISDLSNILQQKKDKLNNSYIESKEGRKLIRNLVKEIIEEVDEERISYLINFFVNAVTSPNMKEQTILMFNDKLLQMQPIHLQTLRILHEPRESISYILSNNKDRKRLKLPADFNEYLNADPFIFEGVIDDLKTWNILKSSVGETTMGNLFKDTDQTINSVVKDTKNRFSGLGDEFVKFMKKGEISLMDFFIDFDKKETYYHSKMERTFKIREIERHNFSIKHDDFVDEKSKTTDGNTGRLTFG